MNKAEQEHFIETLVDAVKRTILSHSAEFPVEWDGVELRQYIVDSFRESAVPFTLTGKRHRDYNNTLAITNL